MTKVTVFDTELQNKIATLLVNDEKPKDVAIKCDCSIDTVYDVQKSAKYVQYVHSSITMQLIGEGMPLALKHWLAVLRDKKASTGAKNTAADKIFHYTGIVVSEQGKAMDKSPANMSQSELQDRLKQLQSEAANRAKPMVIEQGVDDLLT